MAWHIHPDCDGDGDGDGDCDGEVEGEDDGAVAQPGRSGTAEYRSS